MRRRLRWGVPVTRCIVNLAIAINCGGCFTVAAVVGAVRGPYAYVDVRVVDAQSGLPVENATVQSQDGEWGALGRTAYTRGDGTARLRVPANGCRGIDVTAAGYLQDAAAHADVAGPVDVEFALHRDGGPLPEKIVKTKPIEPKTW